MEKFIFLSKETIVDKTETFCTAFSFSETSCLEIEDSSQIWLNSDISQENISEFYEQDKRAFFLLKQLSTVILPAIKSAWGACFYKVCYNQNYEREV